MLGGSHEGKPRISHRLAGRLRHRRLHRMDDAGEHIRVKGAPDNSDTDGALYEAAEEPAREVEHVGNEPRHESRNGGLASALRGYGRMVHAIVCAEHRHETGVSHKFVKLEHVVDLLVGHRILALGERVVSSLSEAAKLEYLPEISHAASIPAKEVS